VNHVVLIALEMGDKASRALIEQREYSPSKVFSLGWGAAQKHPMFDAWLWTLWDKFRAENGIHWIDHWFVCFEDLPLRMSDSAHRECNLSMAFPWPSTTRRPMVLDICGRYYVQSVRADTAGREDRLRDNEMFELWECDSALQAISAWCCLMYERFECKMIDQFIDLSSALHKFIINREVSDAVFVPDFEEEGQRVDAQDWNM
jgi:hypothetical protein